MNKLPQFGTAIAKIVQPTLATYAPLVQANAAAIKSTPREEYQYGPHDRQKLDVYHPAKPSIVNGRKAVFVFLYGGGLVRGEKRLPVADGLVYTNLGAFFAQKYGYTTILADYRLMSHGAKFPSGGEDVALVLDWIVKNGAGKGAEAIDLFLMGNSAGGIHLTTFLFHPSFAKTRDAVAKGSQTQLKGAILLSVPFEFGKAEDSRAEVLTAYFNDDPAKYPLGVLRAARTQHKRENFLPGVKVLMLNGDLDPEDEILEPKEDFLREWREIENAELREAMEVDMMKGHNHISPALSLSTGIEAEEAWGHQVGDFCERARK